MVWFTHHSGKCGFQTFQKVKCSPRFSRLDFQDNSYNFWQKFLSSLSTGKDCCFIAQQTWFLKKGVFARSICEDIESGRVFVGKEGGRGKYKIIPRFQISKGVCLHAVTHKLRKWHLKLLKPKILFNHVIGNITFTLHPVSLLLVDRNSILMNNWLLIVCLKDKMNSWTSPGNLKTY